VVHCGRLCHWDCRILYIWLSDDHLPHHRGKRLKRYCQCRLCECISLAESDKAKKKVLTTASQDRSHFCKPRSHDQQVPTIRNGHQSNYGKLCGDPWDLCCCWVCQTQCRRPRRLAMGLLFPILCLCRGWHLRPRNVFPTATCLAATREPQGNLRPCRLYRHSLALCLAGLIDPRIDMGRLNISLELWQDHRHAHLRLWRSCPLWVARMAWKV
jgi:hypothetical protein